MKRLAALPANDRGATSIEYAAIASLVSIVAIGANGCDRRRRQRLVLVRPGLLAPRAPTVDDRWMKRPLIG